MTQRDFDALGFLLSRPWYRRVWIQQEIVLAASFELHCGQDLVIPSRTLFAVCKVISGTKVKGHKLLLRRFHPKVHESMNHIMGLNNVRDRPDPNMIRIVASSAVCSSCYCAGSKCASTSTAAPAVVRKAPVIICAARFYILATAATIELPLPMQPLPRMCHAEQP